ncbi:MAG: antibiotic biosynthesis monooxygenase [bacterium]|nr:antibiotic biosynthesis monooxygenase [bacterium]
MKKYGLFGKFVVTESDRDTLVKILLEAAKLLDNNEDCLQYLVGISELENEVWVSEVWTTKTAHDKSLEPEDIRKLIMQARPLIQEMHSVAEYEVVGGKSSRLT